MITEALFMKKAIGVFLAVIIMLSSFTVVSLAANDYVINSPYEDVIWEGDGAYKAYKGNLHTHSFISDGNVDNTDMIIEHYNQGFDFLAMTDHGVTGKAWNEKPTELPLYAYQKLIGNNIHYFSDEDFNALQDGTYPVNGEARGYGMTCVSGGNELNALTITKCHVNGMFLPTNVGNNHLGYENNHECAVKLVDEVPGAYSFINHPGDWLEANRDRSVYNDPANIAYFSNIILKYDSCLGMEVYNEKNSVTPCDTILWDNVLMECLPYGKTVIAFSNSDAHTLDLVDSSYSIFMMTENTQESIKETMKSGAFFCVTRNLPANEKFGPTEGFNVRNTDLPVPEFTQLTVDGHTVTIKVRNCNDIKWIANGNVIAAKTLTQTTDETVYTIDLDTIEGAESFMYIRCQLLGEGGCTLSQALVIDDGSEKLTYESDTSSKAQIQTALYRIKSLRIFVLIQKIFSAIKNAC